MKQNPFLNQAMTNLYDLSLNEAEQLLAASIVTFYDTNRKGYLRMAASLSESTRTANIAAALRLQIPVLWPSEPNDHTKNPVVNRAIMLSKAMELLDIGIPHHVCFKLIAVLSIVDQKGDQFSLKDACSIKEQSENIWGE